MIYKAIITDPNSRYNGRTGNVLSIDSYDCAEIEIAPGRTASFFPGEYEPLESPDIEHSLESLLEQYKQELAANDFDAAADIRRIILAVYGK